MARQILDIAGYRHTPIIAITGNAFSEDRQRFLAAGMNDFLKKTLFPVTLFAALLRCLGQMPG